MNNNGSNKNVLLAIALSAAVLFAWQYFIATPAMKAEQARQATLTSQQKAKPAAGAPSLPGIAAASTHMSREAALKAGGPRITVDTPMVDGSILLKGARIDDLRLKKYHDTVDPKSPEIVLLAPKGTAYPYSAAFGWVGASNMPNDKSEWRQTGWRQPGRPGIRLTLTLGQRPWSGLHPRHRHRQTNIWFTVSRQRRRIEAAGPCQRCIPYWHGGAGRASRRTTAFLSCM
jgi:YidC/Oxa1 family membrane protein insertase